MKSLSKATVQNISSQLNNGKSCREVSKNLHISFSSVQRVRENIKEHILIQNGGRPSKVTRVS